MIAYHHWSGGVYPEAYVVIRSRSCEIVRSVGYLKSCVVENDVKLCALFVDSAAHFFYLFHVGELCCHNVSVNAQRLYLAEDLCAVLLCSAVENEVAALLSHENSGKISDSTARARNERPFAFYVYHVFFLP